MSEKTKGRTVSLTEQRVVVGSGFGATTRQPYVALSVNGQETKMTPAKAREIAMMLLSAADAAESDGFLVEWMGAEAGLNDQQRVMLLREFRAYRDQERARQAKHDYPPNEAA